MAEEHAVNAAAGLASQAMLLTALVIFGGFTVIPYITLYAIANVGIAADQIPLIYFLGGAAAARSPPD